MAGPSLRRLSARRSCGERGSVGDPNSRLALTASIRTVTVRLPPVPSRGIDSVRPVLHFAPVTDPDRLEAAWHLADATQGISLRVSR